eukprot:GHVU01137408.1.p1 GENE.GHVU01137408.1~~GHVU01137408.1.p1  ORF type:complete len:130 (-),score=1.14 GHVU01137408.1:240-629(-)
MPGCARLIMPGMHEWLAMKPTVPRLVVGCSRVSPWPSWPRDDEAVGRCFACDEHRDASGSPLASLPACLPRSLQCGQPAGSVCYWILVVGQPQMCPPEVVARSPCVRYWIRTSRTVGPTVKTREGRGAY